MGEPPLDLRALEVRLVRAHALTNPHDRQDMDVLADAGALLSALRALRHAGQLVVQTLGTEDTVVQELADELARVRDAP